MMIKEITRQGLIEALLDRWLDNIDDAWETLADRYLYGSKFKGFNNMTDGELVKIANEEELFTDDNDELVKIKIIQP